MQNRIVNDLSNVNRQLIRSAAITLGISRLAELLVVFEARIEWLTDALVALPYNHAGILATLHQSRGSAATLGFTALERVLADIEMQLSSGSDTVACRSSGGVARKLGAVSPSHHAVDTLREAWPAALAAAALHVPDLRHHRPFGSKK